MNTSFFDPKTTPFHKGELAVQRRVGVLENVHSYAPKFVRNFLPDQHREFYGQLPQIVVGSLDQKGRPWASMVVGQSGFISSPDRETLVIDNAPLSGDPLSENVEIGSPLGFLGIEFHTRRRNRLAGKVRGRTAKNGFTVDVDQSFGNCPQYIQARTPAYDENSELEVLKTLEEKSGKHSEILGKTAKGIIGKSDTFFIATAYYPDNSDHRFGVDVSHRGGKPGFLKVVDDTTLLFPDFPGNNHFNTFGNIEVYPKAGLLVPDFETGDLLYITGEAEVIWDGPEVQAFADAQRLVQIKVEEVRLVEKSLTKAWKFESYSPSLNLTGTWKEAEKVLFTLKDRDAWRRYVVAKIEKESKSISSFYLVPEDKKALADYEPGQHLPIRVDIPNKTLTGGKQEVRRTYTISNAFNGRYYRLSIKREEAGSVSRHLHDRMKPGDIIEAQGPRGDFYLDRESTRPVVLLSGGVGVTPMMAMAEALLEQEKKFSRGRKVHFIHGARNGNEHAFGKYTNALATWFDCFEVHNTYSQPESSDVLGKGFQDQGRIDLNLLREHLSLDDYDFYLCGPQKFMKSVYETLRTLGVREERIRYETFGPSMVLKSPTELKTSSEEGRGSLEMADQSDLPQEPVMVRFASTGQAAEWRPEKGSLLQFVEENGFFPDFSCRSGNCGACVTKLKSGAVSYPKGYSAGIADDEVLLCSAVPQMPTGHYSDEGEVVLDL
ncbi:pyridoxamine 5'-phosphate oxidase family protein [uncultured Kiloniella sp.]|uniref:FAD-binding oxidoreductase n=1 Tax=uncultured Kiloniella sp. TaxID=1133091 RepID=UPI0026364E2C|nr:pyridoxamine 5'-phosphate oxidase family protein [uncultured Kiloniella sp.]